MSSLRVPIFSMRSHETGQYAVLKDGNFQLHLHRAESGDIICVPKNSSDLKELRELFPEFHFCELNYADNAYETRKTFWDENQFVVDSLMPYYDCSVLVTDITGYKGYEDVFFNFNVTLDPNHPRYYIDEFIDIDVASINKEQCVGCTVLNQCQKDVLVSYGADADKIEVNQRVIRPSVIERFAKGLEPLIIDGIFHPFRISDPCYRFNDVLEIAAQSNKTVYITDPNNSFDEKEYEHQYDIKLFKPSKRGYYRILKGHPSIVYLENPEKVFHPGLAEFIYFGAFIYSEYNIPKREDILIEE